MRSRSGQISIYGIVLSENSKQWLFEFLVRSSDKEITILDVSFWYIWEARNEARHSPEIPNPRHMMEKIRAYTNLILQHLFNYVPMIRRESS